ncbi:MAG: DUF3320 domain-containing protein [Alphaproteobacteria bacterium]
MSEKTNPTEDAVTNENGDADQPKIEVSYTASDHVNIAFFQNAVPILRGVSIKNNLPDDLTDVSVTISSEPAFISPGNIKISRINAGAQYHLPTPDLKIDQSVLSNITASRRSEIIIHVKSSDDILLEHRIDTNLLPPGFWGGSNSSPELLAAFVTPTDPSVDVILRDAAEKLKQAGREPSIDGYKSGKKRRIWEIADAIWAAMVGYTITYVHPPASFEKSGQLVRSPSDILNRRVGTCLDLALTYASCLEEAGLNPIIVLTEGHALVGLWLNDSDFNTTIVDDPQMLRKRIQLDELILLESTFIASTPPGRFSQALNQGKSQVAEELDEKFEVAIDIRRARRQQIRPIDLAKNSSGTQSPNIVLSGGIELEPPPTFEEDITPPAEPISSVTDRLEIWKMRLLDLSLKNKLLNFKDGNSTISVACTNLSILEDFLSAGKAFKIRSRAAVIGEDGRDISLLRERIKDDAYRLYIDDALQRFELHTDCTEDQLIARLTDLYRSARTAFEEGGSNILFLSLGFLKWTPADRDNPYKAPLILIPVRLERRSVRSGFELLLHEDEIRFNPTLLLMLRQDFHMSIPEIDAGLPLDGSGIDVNRILRSVKDRIKDIRGWEVTDEVVLSTISFTKYLMWKDLVDRTDELKQNDVVKHLIDTPKHTYEKGEKFVSPRELDKVVEPAELFMPLSADSSQTAAVVAAARGKDFVLFGPPGTGKSQTITNMITTCLAHGKTVLFVSQKTAALEVVQRRLNEIGLGTYCLEVHSSKAQKSKVVEQLKIAWRERQSVTELDWVAANEDLKAKRDELNKVVSSLHRRRDNGISAYDAFSQVVGNRNRYPEIKIGWDSKVHHTIEDLKKLRGAVHALKTTLQAIGSSSKHPLNGMRQTRWSPAWREEFLNLANTLVEELNSLIKIQNLILTSLNLSDEFSSQEKIFLFNELLGIVLNKYGNEPASLLKKFKDDLFEQLNSFEKIILQSNEIRRKLNGKYNLRILKANLTDLQMEWAAALSSNFITRSGKKDKIRQKIKLYCDEVPSDLTNDLELLISLADFLPKLNEFENKFGKFSFWNGWDTDVSKFKFFQEWIRNFESSIFKFSITGVSQKADLRDTLLNLIIGLPDNINYYETLNSLHNRLNNSQKNIFSYFEKLENSTKVNSSYFFANEKNWIDLLIAKLDRWISSINDSPAWCRWCAAVQEADAIGLTPLIAEINKGTILSNDLEPAFEYAYASWLANCIVNEDEVLSSFLVEEHEAKIESFRRADERVSELSRQIVCARIGGNVPGMTSFGTDPEWGLLSREIQRSKLPIRQLFKEIPTALTKLAPCMMMSPLSIAQYLPTNSKIFDVVIVDEASQIPVWDAIGALARGKQVIVVGDPEQLPPTSVGERGADDADQDNISDLPSILDECLGANLPHLELTWHYRSKHESLIAFSNAKYYRGRLVTFPSPNTKDTAVSFIHVPDGIYERGSGRVNRKEADKLVSHLVHHLKTSPLSIGVVTFNSEQQRLIENLLDQARMSDPTLEMFFDPLRTREPVIVKNLENVQGDERDVIYFSIAVGKDQAGVIRAQISSLNKEGGHRRLNVAVTRAREELKVFSSMRAAQIDMGRTNSRGVRDFKHFLEFSERGPKAIAEAFELTGRATDSPFEDAVKAALESKGWEVHPQVGVSHFRIDLGIVNPVSPGKYLAGVECDGAAYHSSATARDRDRLREIVLKDLGWNIRRIWSTDWWMNPHLSLERIHNILVDDLATYQENFDMVDHSDVDETEKSISVSDEGFVDDPSIVDRDDFETVATIKPEASNSNIEIVEIVETTQRQYADRQNPKSISLSNNVNYRIAKISDIIQPDQDRFYDTDYRGSLATMVEYVIETEGPIFRDLIITRIREAHGFQRARDQIRDIVTKAIGNKFRSSVEADGRSVLWPNLVQPTSVFQWRGLGGRNHLDIPICELSGLASLVNKDGMSIEDIVRSMQEYLQLGRLHGTTRQRFEEAANILKDR